MNSDLESILDRCLDLLQEGRSVEQCVHRYPEVADELEPLLRVAGDLQRLPRAEPRPAALRAALLRVGSALPRQAAGHRRGQGRDLLRRWSFPVRSVVLRWSAAAAAIVVLTLGLGAASAQSVPGNLLYPLKLVTERVAFALTTSPDRRAELRLSFADSRLEELVRTAQASGRVDPALLKRLLGEATLALEEAKPTSDERYQQLLTRIDAFNAYQKRVLERLRPAVHPDDSQLLTRAISVCNERSRWMERRWRRYDAPVEQPPGTQEQRPRRGPSEDRSWGSDCRWD
ncbi:MAG: hypothetical protein F9K18_01050 [Thermoanaerobaculia bacterium]|nr:MAG: hypothetical protein F9K18_01050 [Thermoanaerobaculia bacterium]